MVEQEKWKWQEPGTAWKGIGLYHITLTIPDRRPLLGCLEIPDNDPCKAKVRRTVLGNALVDCLLSIPRYHPEVQVLHFCLMPDHLHAVLYVRRTMATGIKGLVRGFWQAAKKLGRASSVASSIAPNDIRRNSQEETTQRSLHIQEETPKRSLNSQEETPKRSLQSETTWLEAYSAGLREQMGDDAYYQLPSVFTEMPFIRPMGRNTQLPNTIRYIDMNPQRLATKNSCVLSARQGAVMVSPFISDHEKQVMQVLLREHLPFIYLVDNGFRDYYKPSDALFDACAAGRVLILSPWPYDATKRHISRADCVALNTMAEEIQAIVRQKFA